MTFREFAAMWTFIIGITGIVIGWICLMRPGNRAGLRQLEHGQRNR